MKHCTCVLITGCAALVLAIGGLTGQQPAKKPTGEALTGQRADDEAAIKKAGQSFLKAYMAGDAKGMAAHWTENGEYFAEDGTTLRSRAVIEKAYRESFDKKKQQIVAEIEVTSIRFPSKDTAVEEGFFRVRTG